LFIFQSRPDYSHGIFETMVNSQTVRRFILTGSVAAITITGTVYGAQLKTDQERSQVHPHLHTSPNTKYTAS
jgi:hypothetical protein